MQNIVDDYLYQKDLWKLLEGKTKNRGTMKNEEWKILNRKELESILLCLAPLVTFNITKVKTMEELMETLAKLYGKP